MAWGKNGGRKLSSAKNWLKLNWDATLDVKKQVMGGGIVIRNRVGDLIASASWSRKYVTNPMLAKHLVLERATKLVGELGLHQIVFEGDALNEVKEVNSKDVNWVWYGQKIEDLKQFFGSMVTRQIQFIPRSGNQATHIMAKLALHFVDELVWIQEGPLEIMHCIELEKSVLDS